jgi:hypothetical protein
MTICVAFDTFQLSCHEVPPRLLAVKLITGLLAVVCGTADTVIIVDDLITVPAELVALMVYTVDFAGDTTLVPAVSTWPMPWSILTDVAPVTFHIRVDVPPELIVDGLLLNSIITGVMELTVVTADLVTVPEELVALIVYTVDVAGDTTLVPAVST